MTSSKISKEVKPINILHISAAKTWGGGENHIVNLCTELQDEPQANNLILCVEKGFLHQRLQNTEINFYTAPLANKMDLRFILKIGSLCKKKKIDLIHIHDTTALSLAVMADHIYDLPPFVFSKKTSFPIRNRKQTLFKYNYRKIKLILCVSETTRKVTSPSIEDPSRLKVVYHGTRLDNKSANTPFLLREKLDLPLSKKIIGNIANHIRAKHLETLIGVADILINQQKHTQFYFVQIGSFSGRTEDLKKKIQSLNLQDHIKLLDFLPEASNFIPQFDITLITSQSEGIPQVIYESFYHEVPVISTRAGGIPEIIKHEENGYLTEKYDYRKIAGHIVSLSSDVGLQKKFTDNSKKILLENFTTRKMAQQTLKEYKEVINGRSK